MDNKVNFLRGTATEYAASTKDNDTFYYTTDDEKLYLGNKEITGGGVTIDDTLSDTSKNPVQNKVINAALNSKANLSDIPTTLPANGGNADTVDGKHASDFALKTDIPTTLPANGGMADAARETVSPNAKAKLWEDPEGGNLRLVSPDGNHSVEMDLYNNEGFRMYFTDNGELTFPVSYDSSTKKFNINGNAATVNGLTVQTAVPANAKFTDTKVTAVGNHYTPSGGTTTSASGGSLTDITNSSSGVQVVTGVTKDAAGHVTGVTSVALKSTNTNTTYGAASTSTNGLMTTGAQTLAGNKTFNGQIIPAGASAVGTAQARKIYAGTSDMTAGTTKLETGAIYLVYE